MDIESARSLWDPKTIYLNTATYGLPPQPAWEALQTALDEWRHGRTGFLGWDESVSGSRRAFANMVGVREESVATSATVASLAGFVAAALPDGSSVVAPEIEFTSALWPWMVHSDRGVSVRTVPLNQLIDAIDRNTDLVALSAVQSASGEVAKLDDVLSAAQEVGAQVFLDATQACGWMHIDASRFDYVVCGAYKWLMALRGTAFMTVAPQHLDSLRPMAANWYGGEEVHESYYGPPLRLAGSARRLDISPAWFCWVSTQPSLELLLSIGVENINRHNVGLANRFLEGLGHAPGNSAIVRVPVPDADERLRRAGVMAAVRAGHVRASFHLYNTESDVDAALDALGAK
jgi:selenocysteine lyase/cysteine desulfurase